MGPWKIFDQADTGPYTILYGKINGATINFTTGHRSFPGGTVRIPLSSPNRCAHRRKGYRRKIMSPKPPSAIYPVTETFIAETASPKQNRRKILSPNRPSPKLHRRNRVAESASPNPRRRNVPFRYVHAKCISYTRIGREGKLYPTEQILHCKHSMRHTAVLSSWWGHIQVSKFINM